MTVEGPPPGFKGILQNEEKNSRKIGVNTGIHNT